MYVYIFVLIFAGGLTMMKLVGLCRRKPIHRFHNGFILILLMSFWLMCHILSTTTFTKQTQRDAPEENLNLTNAIILSMVPQVRNHNLMIFMLFLLNLRYSTIYK